jgi:hypothetical protein
MVLKTWPKSEAVGWGVTDEDGHHAVTIDETGQASVWDLSSREKLFDLMPGFSAGRACFHPSSIRGALLGADGEVARFEITEGGATTPCSSPEPALVAIEFLGDRLLGLDENGGLWSLSDREPEAIGGTWAGWATCSFSPTPETIVVGTASGRLETFDERGQRMSASVQLHQDAVVALLGSLEELISVSADADVRRVKDITTGKLNIETVAEFPGRTVVDCCLAAGGDRLWLALDEGLICWLSLSDPNLCGEHQLAGRSIEEIRPAGDTDLVVLTDRGSVKRLRTG